MPSVGLAVLGVGGDEAWPQTALTSHPPAVLPLSRFSFDFPDKALSLGSSWLLDSLEKLWYFLFLSLK